MRSKRKPVPKLDDVATRAGVSAATVSRFYNNPGIVAPETAKRIRAAIQQTGYVPNALAGGLASNRSRLVAVLVREITQSPFNDTIEAMCAELSKDGIVVMLGLTGGADERVDTLIEAALARRADAIILTGLVTRPSTRQLLRNRETAVIEIWGLPREPIDFAVGFSHDAVGVETARFLRERGYRRPFLVVADGARARQRRDGFVREWSRAGRDAARETVVPIPTRFGHSRRVWRELSELKPRPDVVVCGSDLLAQGVITEALVAGVKVPDELAVVGFGNQQVAGEMRPTITTVDVDGARIGREAVALLKQRSAGRPPAQRVVDVGFRIIARESA